MSRGVGSGLALIVAVGAAGAVCACGGSRPTAAPACAHFGDVRTVTGGRQRTGQLSGGTYPPSPAVLARGRAAYDAIALHSVTVGRTGSRLCVEFAAGGPLVEETAYELYMSAQDKPPGGRIVIKLQVVRYRGRTFAQLRYPGDDSYPGGPVVKARISAGGGRTSVIIDRSRFPHWWPFVRFQFYANGVAPGASGAPQQQYAVTLPSRPAQFP